MDQDSAFTVTVEDRGDRSSVQATGELDLAAEHAWNAALVAAGAHPSQRVEVDLSEVTFIDSCGLRLVLVAWNRADASDAEAMTIVNMSSAVHQVAELTGVLEMLEPVRSER